MVEGEFDNEWTEQQFEYEESSCGSHSLFGKPRRYDYESPTMTMTTTTLPHGAGGGGGSSTKNQHMCGESSQQAQAEQRRGASLGSLSRKIHHHHNTTTTEGVALLLHHHHHPLVQQQEQQGPVSITQRKTTIPSTQQFHARSWSSKKQPLQQQQLWLLLGSILLWGVGVVVSESYDSYDGRGNNQNHPNWGAMNTPRIRSLPPFARYFNTTKDNDKDDNGTNNQSLPAATAGINTTTPNTTTTTTLQDDNDNNIHHIPLDEINSNLPSSRRIMEELFRFATPQKDKLSNHLLLEFGHFIVQDIIMGASKNISEPFHIPCDGRMPDIIYCPVMMTMAAASRQQEQQEVAGVGSHSDDLITTDFFRFQHVIVPTEGEGEGEDVPQRSTINPTSSFLDLSQIYGLSESDVLAVRGDAPRGQVKLDDLNLLPKDGFHLNSGPNAGYNAVPGVFCFYVIFMRYHNHLAKEYAVTNQQFSDDTIFQMARQRTIAVYQSYVEDKYIPTLTGDRLDLYTGYKDDVNPSIDEFFATVSFRYAHSSLSGIVRLVDEEFNPTPYDLLSLRDVFFQSPPNDVRSLVERTGGIEPIVRGLTINPSKAIDASIVEDLNLWKSATSAADVQRGRDVGIPPYNDVREAFGLPRATSFEDLVGRYGYDEDDDARAQIVNILQSLYGENNIDKVDAYVGALVEDPETMLDMMGPLFKKPIVDQFTRLRDGDRYWYKNIYDADVYDTFPTFSEIIQEVCSGMENFPQDPWQVPNEFSGNGTCEGSSSAQLSLLGGSYLVAWNLQGKDPIVSPNRRKLASTFDGRTIEVSLKAKEVMEGPGFLGIGWGAQRMRGAEMWFCTVNEDVFYSNTEKCPTSTESSDTTSFNENTSNAMFSCCVARGGNHRIDECADENDDVFYELEIIDWCLSSTSSSVRVRAPVCSDQAGQSHQRDCFRLSSSPDGRMDFIIGYNPFAQHRSHGYQRRTWAQVDLKAGILTENEAGVVDSGLIATHGAFMLFGWMFCAPWGIFMVRYMKTRRWYLAGHISVMGFVGSLMIPLVIGVEASVGATDKVAEHSLVGLMLMGCFFLMVFAGRIRYLRLEGHKVGRKKDIISKVIHVYGGYVILALSWWNCYTGLIRIGPEDSYFEIVVLGSFSMGYNNVMFGALRKYVFFPYMAFVVLVFLIAEIRSRRNHWVHKKKLSSYLAGTGSVWGDDDGSGLETMTIETFLEATRLGSSLCIVDGRVLDIGNFAEVHPGGRELLRFATATDITRELCGEREVDGVRHVHSKDAIRLLKSLVQAKLVNDDRSPFEPSETFSHIATAQDEGSLQVPPTSKLTRSVSTQAFRPARIVAITYLTPGIEVNSASKPVILLRLSMPRSSGNFVTGDATEEAPFLPSAAFTFRGADKQGRSFERQYTPVHIDEDGSGHRNKEVPTHEEAVDFVISLIPGGKMSEFLKRLKMGKTLLVQGPKINPTILKTVRSTEWKSVVMLAGGTGISPMLQLIDNYMISQSMKKKCPQLFLVWILTSPMHAYPDAIALKDKVKLLNGKLKWVIIYSSSDETKQSERSESMEKQKRGFRTSVETTFRTTDNRTSVTKLLNSTRGRQSVVSKLLNSQRGGKSTVSIDKMAIPWNVDGSHEINGEFWSRANRCIANRCDRDLLNDVIKSAERFMEGRDKELDSRIDEALSETTREMEEAPSLLESSSNDGDEDTAPSKMFPGKEDGLGTVIGIENENDSDFTDKSNPNIVRMGDLESGEQRHSTMLVTLSGSPGFEMDMYSNLKSLGLNTSQVVRFHESSKHI